MTNMTTTKKKAKKSLRRQQEYKQGRAYAREWMLESRLLDIRELIDAYGWSVPPDLRRPWAYCPLPDLQEKLKLQGKLFSNGFLQELLILFQSLQPAFEYHCHHEGVNDGRRWGTEFASPGQLARMLDFSISPCDREVFVSRPYVNRPWTPAHELVCYMFDDTYPVGDGDGIAEDCTEFREFWQPFISEPMDEVMSKLKAVPFRGFHKLQESSYLAGFVNGALGLSEQLRKRIAEREPVQSQIAENDQLTC